MTDTVLGEVVDFPTRPIPTDGDEFLIDRPGPAVDGSGDGGWDGPRLPAVPVPGDDPDRDGDGLDGDEDRESVVADRVLEGVPVDPPDELHTRRRGASVARAPVIPPWMASRQAVTASAVWAAREARYHAGFHAVRSPKYATKTAVYGLAGLFRVMGRLIKWASAEDGNWHLRQAAAQRGEAETWLRLDARRQ